MSLRFSPIIKVAHHDYNNFPCRLCLHVVVVVGLERLSDFRAMKVEPPDKPKVRFQTTRDATGLRRARVVEGRFREASAHQTVTVQANPQYRNYS